MRKLRAIMPLLVVAFLLAIPVTPVFAATSATVDVNATPSYICIAVNQSTFDFSAVKAGVDEDTTQGYFGITNTSSVVSSTTIVSNGWTGPVNSWTWAAAAADTSQLKASDGDSAWDVTVDDTTPATLASATAATTDWVFELQIDSPSSFTYADEQTTTVTLACTAD